MLPPITPNDLIDCQNHQINHHQSKVNRSSNRHYNQSSQGNTAEQMTRPPVKSFIRRKKDNDSTHEAILRLYEGDLPSIDHNHIMVNDADRINEASCLVSQYIQYIVSYY